MRRAVDATRLKFRHHTWGPRELFYGDLYASREVPCKSTSIPGNRDRYSACCAAEMAQRGRLRLPALLAARQRQLLASLRARRRASSRSPRPTTASAKLVEAAGGLDAFLDDHALILVADHAQTPVDRGLPLAELLGREWTVLQPSDDRRSRRSSRSARPAARPTSTCCPARASGPTHEEVAPAPRRDRRRRPGLLAASGATAQPLERASWASPAQGGCVRGGRAAAARSCASAPATRSATCAADSWEVEGELGGAGGGGRGRSAAQRGLPRPARPRLVGA